MNQLTIFNQDQEIKSLLERMEKTSAISSSFKILADRFNELTGTEFRGSELYYQGTDTIVDVEAVEAIHHRVGYLPATSMRYRLNAVGVKTVRDGSNTNLEYCGKTIARPLVDRCPAVVKREFGIEI